MQTEPKHSFEIETDALADVHFHLREGDEIMTDLMKHAVAGGADIIGLMPNTRAGLKTAREVAGYTTKANRLAIISALNLSFMPFMMLTEDTTETEIEECARFGILHVKVYPRFRTTNSDYGVVRYAKLLPAIQLCAKHGIICHFHPEHPNMNFTNRDAEFVFLPIARMFLEETDAKIVWEHGTDARCIPHWKEMAETGRLLLTLTAHHLATNEDQVFGDVRGVCKPPVKTEVDRQALIALVREGNPWVMAGTDSAYHREEAKLVHSGRCACGAFTAPFALPLYAHVLDDLLQTENGLDVFRNFTSRNARSLYNLPPASRTIRLERKRQCIPSQYSVGGETALPFMATQWLEWQIVP